MQSSGNDVGRNRLFKRRKPQHFCCGFPCMATVSGNPCSVDFQPWQHGHHADGATSPDVWDPLIQQGNLVINISD